jgi:hypothetical protein
MQQGYPPRPDPITQPRLYSQWVQGVSQPSDRYQLASVTALGLRLNTASTDCSANWAGFVQAAAGYPSESCATNQPVSGSQLYEEYVAATQFPSSNCSLGPCDTSIWAGIGGVVSLYGSGQVLSNIIQHGFLLTGTNLVKLVWQYANGTNSSNSALPPVKMVAGDEVLLAGAGWSSNGCPSTGVVDSSAPWGCYEWFDYTQGTSCYAIFRSPGGTWFPTTTEYVMEVPGGSPGNATYTPFTFEGWGVDWYGTDHEDPGNASGTDAFNAYFQGDFQMATWANGSANIALDPMNFAWESYH